jgi:hypothetical protein
MTFSESAMAVGTGFGQLFRSVGQVRSIPSKLPNLFELLPGVGSWRSCISRPFSSLFSIGNFETESTGLNQISNPKLKIPQVD